MPESAMCQLKDIKLIAAASGCCQRLQGEIKDATSQLVGENPFHKGLGGNCRTRVGKTKRKGEGKVFALDSACNKIALGGDII